MTYRYRTPGLLALFVVLALATGCGASQTPTSTTSAQVSEDSSTTSTTSIPTETSSTQATSSETITSSSEMTDTTTSQPSAGTPSVAELDAICSSARDVYHSTEPSPSSGADPTTLQIKANNLLAAAAEKIRGAGATELADALDRQVEAGKALAAAMSEGRLGESESQALDAAGKATAAAAQALGSTACEQLGGL